MVEYKIYGRWNYTHNTSILFSQICIKTSHGIHNISYHIDLDSNILYAHQVFSLYNYRYYLLDPDKRSYNHTDFAVNGTETTYRNNFYDSIETLLRKIMYSYHEHYNKEIQFHSHDNQSICDEILDYVDYIDLGVPKFVSALRNI